MRLLSLMALCGIAYGQQPQQSLTLSANAPPQVQGISVSATNRNGAMQRCFWVQAVYRIGYVMPAGPACIDQLSASSSITIGWGNMGAIAYYLFRTNDASQPGSNHLIGGSFTTSFTTTIDAPVFNHTIPSGVGSAQGTLSLNNKDYTTPRFELDRPFAKPMLGTYTVALLPAGVERGTTVYVTDGTSTSDCTVGGGASFALCGYNGGWVSVGGTSVTITAGSGILTSLLGFDYTLTADYATQAEAETGTNNAKLMTPLRTAQAIIEQCAVPDQTGNAGKILVTDASTASWTSVKLSQYFHGAGSNSAGAYTGAGWSGYSSAGNTFTAAALGTDPHRMAYLSAADDADRYVTLNWMIPPNWDSTSDITFVLKWATNNASNDVVWSLSTASSADGDAGTAPAYNAAQSVTVSSPGTAIRSTSLTADKTGFVAGSIAHFQILSTAADSNAGTFQLFGATIQYRVAQ